MAVINIKEVEKIAKELDELKNRLLVSIGQESYESEGEDEDLTDLYDEDEDDGSEKAASGGKGRMGLMLALVGKKSKK